MMEMNKELLIFLNSLLDYKAIEYITLVFADWPIFFLPIFLVWFWIYHTYKTKNNDNKKDLLFIFYSAVIAIIINLIIQQIVHLDRPEEAIKWVWKLLLDHIPDASFPSDHTAVWISFLTALFLANYKKIWLIFFLPAILMVISRVILWVHWPLDIVAWSFVWIISAFISFKLIKKSKCINKFNDFIIKIMNYIKL